jgi:DDE superfamily endonuclease
MDKCCKKNDFKECFVNRNSFNVLHGLLGMLSSYLRFFFLNSTCLLLEPYITKQDTRWRRAVPSQIRPIAYLLYVTQGMTYTHISMLLGIGVMTACECIHQCTYAICRHMFAAYIRLPTAAEARLNMEKWKQQTEGLPGIYGAIDGTHISIKRLCKDGSDYFNRKGYYSINMQGYVPSMRLTLIEALVDFKKRFLDVEIRWPGSVGDIRIFQNSCLNCDYEAKLAELGTTPLRIGPDDPEEDIPAFILGDSTYKNSRHLVTTYKVTKCNMDRSDRRLNFLLSKARYRVELAFDLLKGQFQIFKKPLKSGSEHLPFAVHLIASICVIHNFLNDT